LPTELVPALLMPDDHHPAYQAVTLPKKQRNSICILDEAVVGRISDGQPGPDSSGAADLGGRSFGFR